MTPIYRYPARQYKGSFTVTGTLLVEASTFITGPVNMATSLDVDASLDVTGYAAFITTLASCAATL